MYTGNHLWTTQAEQVVVALLQSGQISETLTAEIPFGESTLLYHGTHSTIEYQDALLDNILYLLHSVVLFNNVQSSHKYLIPPNTIVLFSFYVCNVT